MERDLHDGAQQRPLAGAIALGSACSRLARTFGDDAGAALDEIAAELDRGLAELRDMLEQRGDRRTWSRRAGGPG